MDNLLVGTLSLPKLPWREQLALCDVQRYFAPFGKRFGIIALTVPKIAIKLITINRNR